MAFVWLEGFEAFGSSGDPVGMDSVYTIQNITNYSMVSGRLGGTAIEVDSAGSARAFRTPNIVSGNTVTLGFAFYNGGANATRDLVNLYDATGTLSVNLRLLSTNEFEVRRGTVQLGTTTGQAWTGAWHYVELSVVCGNSPSGSYELRIDGVNVLSGSGIDTQASSSGIHASVEWCAACPGGRFDDVYIRDDGTFGGDFKVVTLFPDAAGDSSDFTPSAGSNYQCVDESGHDGDGSYVESGTSGHKDLYGFPAPSDLDTISAVMHRVICRKTDVTNMGIKLIAKVDGNEHVEAAQPVSSVDYLLKYKIHEVSPETEVAWTDSEIGASQFGYEVE